MNFLYYCSDFELFLKYGDDKYDFPNGLICLIDGIPHIAISISTFNTKQFVTYAVFEWSEVDFIDNEKTIKEAIEISKSVIKFTNSTIVSSSNRTMSLAERTNIKSALKYCHTNPIGTLKSYYDSCNFSMIETGTEHKSTWTIMINNNEWITLDSKKAAKTVFKGLE